MNKKHRLNWRASIPAIRRGASGLVQLRPCVFSSSPKNDVENKKKKEIKKGEKGRVHIAQQTQAEN